MGHQQVVDMYSHTLRFYDCRLVHFCSYRSTVFRANSRLHNLIIRRLLWQCDCFDVVSQRHRWRRIWRRHSWHAKHDFVRRNGIKQSAISNSVHPTGVHKSVTCRVLLLFVVLSLLRVSSSNNQNETSSELLNWRVEKTFDGWRRCRERLHQGRRFATRKSDGGTD